jgi:hypothetical protein
MASLCEAFPGRFPTEIWREVLRLPAGLLDEVLEAKAYREAKAMTDAAETTEARQRLPQTPLFALARTIEMALAREALEKKKAQADG